MSVKQANGKTKFETLSDEFKHNANVDIIDFQHGRDDEANKFNAFPMIKIITINGDNDYAGARDVKSMVSAVTSAINNRGQ
jgi:hypothetical protein